MAGPFNGYAVFRYPHLGNASKLGISLCSSTVHHDVRGDAEGQGVNDEGAAEVIDVGVPEAGEATEEMFYNRVN